MNVPSFLRPRDPTPERQSTATQSKLLDQIAADIAAVHADEPLQDTFTDQLHRFGEGADRLMGQHRDNTAKLRAVLAENAVLRARNDDLEQHVADLNAYWERQYEVATARSERLSKHYHSLTGAFDLLIDAMHDTRERAKRDAYAADEVDTPPRPANVEVRETGVPVAPAPVPPAAPSSVVQFDAERFLRDLSPDLNEATDDVPAFLRSSDKLPRPSLFPH
jgi:hypothetical protein